MSRRQIYGGRESDEYRGNASIVADIRLDNDLVEGENVRVLRALLKTQFEKPSPTAKSAIEKYLVDLKKQGFSDSRLQSIYIRASARLAIPDSRKK